MLRAGSLVLVAAYHIFTPQKTIAQESCSPLLQDGIRNNLSEQYEQSFIDSFHSAMCSEEQNQIDRAKSNGIDLGFGDFVANFAGNSRKVSAYQSAMCTSESDVSRGSTFYELTRNHVSTELAEAYVRCVEIQSGGIVYNVSNGIDGDSVSIEVGFNSNLRTPGAKLSLTDIVVSPERHQDKVACAGSLVNELENGVVDISGISGVLTVTCRPKGEELLGSDNDFSIFVHTNLGIIEGFVNPHHSGKDDRIDAIETRLDDELRSVVGRLTDLANEIHNQGRDINALDDSIRFGRADYTGPGGNTRGDVPITIEFNPPFQHTPVFVATASSEGSDSQHVEVVKINKNRAIVNVCRASGGYCIRYAAGGSVYWIAMQR